MIPLETYPEARRHLDDDLVSPAVRRPRRSVLLLTPLGWRYTAVPADSEAARQDRARALAAYRRLGITSRRPL